MDEILKKMKNEVESFTQNYKSDFYDYDIRTYGRMYPETHFIFIVRKNGTYISAIPGMTEGLERNKEEIKNIAIDLINYFSENLKENRFFYVIKNKSIKRLDEKKIKQLTDSTAFLKY